MFTDNSGYRVCLEFAIRFSKKIARDCSKISPRELVPNPPWPALNRNEETNSKCFVFFFFFFCKCIAVVLVYMNSRLQKLNEAAGISDCSRTCATSAECITEPKNTVLLYATTSRNYVFAPREWWESKTKKSLPLNSDIRCTTVENPWITAWAAALRPCSRKWEFAPNEAEFPFKQCVAVNQAVHAEAVLLGNEKGGLEVLIELQCESLLHYQQIDVTNTSRYSHHTPVKFFRRWWRDVIVTRLWTSETY